MFGRNSGVSSLMINDLKNTTNRYLICYCLIKRICLRNVVTVVSKLVNFVRSTGTNYHQYEDLLEDMNSNTEMLCIMRKFVFESWSRDLMFKRMYDLKSEIGLFLEMKRKHFPRLCDYDWMCDFAFCTYINT